MPDFSPIDFAVPGFVLLVMAEMFWARRNRPAAYEARDTLTSLAFGLGSSVAGPLTAGAVFALSLWLYQFRLFDFGSEWWLIWWLWPLCFVLDDLAYYWFHRCAHRVRWFWAAQVVRGGHEHAQPSPGASCDQPDLSRPQLCRYIYCVGPAVWHIPARG